jgi:hypothetical protein
MKYHHVPFLEFYRPPGIALIVIAWYSTGENIATPGIVSTSPKRFSHGSAFFAIDQYVQAFHGVIPCWLGYNIFVLEITNATKNTSGIAKCFKSRFCICDVMSKMNVVSVWLCKIIALIFLVQAIPIFGYINIGSDHVPFANTDLFDLKYKFSLHEYT